MDFIAPDSPVFRCSCPSRQFPCKHALGLLYAYTEGQTFTPAPVPEDIASKREKAEKREENKVKQAAEGAESKPKKVNKSALKKKSTRSSKGLTCWRSWYSPSCAVACPQLTSLRPRRFRGM